jgi:hypothetical protein
VLILITYLSLIMKNSKAMMRRWWAHKSLVEESDEYSKLANIHRFVKQRNSVLLGESLKIEDFFPIVHY